MAAPTSRRGGSESRICLLLVLTALELPVHEGCDGDVAVVDKLVLVHGESSRTLAITIFSEAGSVADAS